MYKNAFNKIERDLRADEGVVNELNYVKRTMCVLFLTYYFDIQAERADRA